MRPFCIFWCLIGLALLAQQTGFAAPDQNRASKGAVEKAYPPQPSLPDSLPRRSAPGPIMAGPGYSHNAPSAQNSRTYNPGTAAIGGPTSAMKYRAVIAEKPSNPKGSTAALNPNVIGRKH